MTRSRARLTVVPALVGCLLVPAAGSAQTTALDGSLTGRKSGTYLKPGLAYWQGDIFSESSLTHWDVDLFGAEYDLTSMGVEIETYLPRRLAGIRLLPRLPQGLPPLFRFGPHAQRHAIP